MKLKMRTSWLFLTILIKYFLPIELSMAILNWKVFFFSSCFTIKSAHQDFIFSVLPDVIILTEKFWRHLLPRGPQRAAAVQKLLVVFEECLSRSLHAWSQPAPLWLGELTRPTKISPSFPNLKVLSSCCRFPLWDLLRVQGCSNLTPLKTLQRLKLFEQLVLDVSFSFCFLSLLSFFPVFFSVG